MTDSVEGSGDDGGFSAESGISSSSSQSVFQSAHPFVTLFHTRSHPAQPASLHCAADHTVVLVTPTLLSFLPLAALSPPAALLAPAASASPATALSAPEALSCSSVVSPFASTFTVVPPAASAPAVSGPFDKAFRSELSRVLELSLFACVPIPNTFVSVSSSALLPPPVSASLYVAVTSRGNALLLSSASSSPPRTLCDLSEAVQAAGQPADANPQQQLLAVMERSITSCCFAPLLDSHQLHVALGSRAGVVTILSLPLPLSSPPTPRLVASIPVAAAASAAEASLASRPHITAVSFSPASTSQTLILAVGSSDGVTSILSIPVPASSSSSLSSPAATHAVLHSSAAPIRDVAVSLLQWHRTDSHTVLATAASSSVTLHWMQQERGGGGRVVSSYALSSGEDERRHITSLLFTQHGQQLLLISSAACSSTLRHRVTPGSCHLVPSVSASAASLLPFPSRYGLALSPDGLLLFSCSVFTTSSTSIKSRQPGYHTLVQATINPLLTTWDAESWVDTSRSAKKRRKGDSRAGGRGEDDTDREERWRVQAQLLHRFVERCDEAEAQGGGGERCVFAMSLFLASLVSPLSLSSALPPAPSSPAFLPRPCIRFLDAMPAFVSSRLEVQASTPPSVLRSLLFLLSFASHHSQLQCQLVPLSKSELETAGELRRRLQSVLYSQHFASQSASSPLISTALRFLSSPQSASCSAASASSETCFICRRAVPFDSVQSGCCAAGHQWWRSLDSLQLMDAGQTASHYQCAQCCHRAEATRAAGSRCWLCDARMQTVGSAAAV